jgi:ATP-dependent exoDNAse (exonuclease V) beta subunit
MLAVSRWDKVDNRSVRPWEELAPFLGAAPQIEARTLVEAAAPAVREIADADRRAAAAQREALLTALLRPTFAIEAVTTSVRGGGHEGTVAGDPYGPAWGRIIHTLLEYAASNPACTRDDIERCAKFHTTADDEAEPFAAVAVNTVLDLMASPFWEHIRAANTRLAEVPVMVEIPGMSPRRFEAGIIDLVLRFDAGWEIIDYKTEAGDLGQLGARYGEQVRRYATHWEQITGERVAFAGIYSVRENALTPDARAGAAS